MCSEEEANKIYELGQRLGELLENLPQETIEAITRSAFNSPELQKEIDEICGWEGLSSDCDHPDEDVD
jgi:hypothetical protein